MSVTVLVIKWLCIHNTCYPNSAADYMAMHLYPHTRRGEPYRK